MMALVVHRRLAIPLWAIAFLTVALTTTRPTTLVVIALLGIAIIFTMPGVVPSRNQRKTRAAVTVAAGTCVRALDEAHESPAEDALDLVRMDDDGGWQMARGV